MKYHRTVIETPTGKYIIVGSDIPEYLDKAYKNREEAEDALALYEYEADKLNKQSLDAVKSYQEEDDETTEQEDNERRTEIRIDQELGK